MPVGFGYLRSRVSDPPSGSVRVSPGAASVTGPVAAALSRNSTSHGVSPGAPSPAGPPGVRPPAFRSPDERPSDVPAHGGSTPRGLERGTTTGRPVPRRRSTAAAKVAEVLTTRRSPA